MNFIVFNILNDICYNSCVMINNGFLSKQISKLVIDFL
ncbi:hypothetical protein A1OE_390 [Candidatus Endolissoclinum faulkneri L2]|uniref:Uncharacterized protein n=1 Tax=Candidatus Endolissoclinum faulkneri L2 TaxID=1193729 RepID=K7YG51_9PROT|nr:hypothetical protein A1OE_390 [Candidatus Endolissoclinum faulkneri L2]